MKRTLAIAIAATIGLSTAAFADALTDSIIADLTAQGYERIEIKKGPRRTKVEAIRGTQKLEQVFDRTTGAVLKEEVQTVETSDNTTPGVSVRDRTEKAARAGDRRRRGHDDNGDGNDRGHGNGRGIDQSDDNAADHSDDVSDDHGGDDHGSDDHSSDDHGSDDNSSDDHSSDDHNGDDHDSSDDDEHDD